MREIIISVVKGWIFCFVVLEFRGYCCGRELGGFVLVLRSLKGFDVSGFFRNFSSRMELCVVGFLVDGEVRTLRIVFI